MKKRWLAVGVSVCLILGMISTQDIKVSAVDETKTDSQQETIVEESAGDTDNEVSETTEIENEDAESGEDENAESVSDATKSQDTTDTESQNGLLKNSWRYQDGELITNPKFRSRSVPNANAWRKINGVYVNSVGEPIKGATKKGIDVSFYQGKIDWAKVKSDGIDFAIIQCGYGDNDSSQDDPQWKYNVSECERLGIPYGVYLYSYATTTTQAKSEAAHVLRLLNGHNPSYPVYLDMEEDRIKSLNPATKGQLAKTFCDTVSAAGYKVGIYANLDWWDKELTDSVFNNSSWSKWVAQYNTTCKYSGTYDLWQCTSEGSVAGINGEVDLNFLMGSMLPFADVRATDWYYDAVLYVYNNGIMTGLNSTKFGPATKVSRAHFVTMLYRMSGSPATAYSRAFPDVAANQFYTSAALWASAAGITTGYDNGYFGPADNITREQMMSMLYRYAIYKGYDVSARGNLNRFRDGGQVSPFALTAAQWCVGAGIITGNENGTLAPQAYADRAAGATTVMRYKTTIK